MFCPKCRTEYLEGIYECTDCGEKLVWELPPDPRKQPLELVTVLTTENPILLALARSILEGEGIPCQVKGEGFHNMFAWSGADVKFSPLNEPVQIQVRKEDENDAREILKDLETESGTG